MRPHPRRRGVSAKEAEVLVEAGVVTVKETCRLLGIGRGAIYRLMNTGQLVYVIIGSDRRIPRIAIRNLLAASYKPIRPTTDAEIHRLVAEGLMEVAIAIRFLSVSRPLLFKWMQAGVLGYVKFDQRRRLSRIELQEFLARRCQRKRSK